VSTYTATMPVLDTLVWHRLGLSFVTERMGIY